MTVLVSGGAGYIGSVTVEQLRAAGERVVVIDDLSRGHREAVDPAVPLHVHPVGDETAVRRIVEAEGVDACIHFAAYAYVGESVEQPGLYFRNNVEQGVRFVEALRAAGVRHFVFSSSCATYGEPEQVPITEDHPQRPSNPYGWTKLLLEKLLEANDHAHGLRSVCLRYFNAAGATATRGECHDPETHLIPNVLRAARGDLSYLSIFGGDYPTPDGTAIRDYVHVSDLAVAHLAALRHLRAGKASAALNLGTGKGHSVAEVIEVARRVTERPIEAKTLPRRPGDPAQLVADPREARRVLGWEARESDLEGIVRSAWEWMKRATAPHRETP